MEKFSQSLRVNANVEDVWKVWGNVSQWHTWDKDVITSNIFGGFKNGTQGKLKPKGGPAVTFTLTEVTPYKSFTTTSIIPTPWLPLAKLIMEHQVQEVSDHQVEITHSVNVVGPKPFNILFYNIIAKKIAANLLQAMQNLAAVAEGKQ